MRGYVGTVAAIVCVIVLGVFLFDWLKPPAVERCGHKPIAQADGTALCEYYDRRRCSTVNVCSPWARVAP